MSTINVVPAIPPIVIAGSAPGVADPGSGGSGSVSSAGLYYDWLIDGVPFLMWPTEEDPYLRDTKEDVKEQFDSSREAGEQSFGYWWLRSQASYHGGAGQNYLDTDQAEVSRIRYSASDYLNPWTPGQLTVNPGYSRITTGARRTAVQVTWAGTSRLAAISSADDTVTIWTLPDLSSSTTVDIATGGSCQAIATDGENLFVAVANQVYKIDQGGTVTLIANVTFVGPVAIGFAKQRVIFTAGPKVYELDPTGGTLAPTVTYTHPSPNWRYTSIADGPNGIYLAGYLGPLSELSLMTVEDAGSGLTLSQPVVQLRTPPSEIIYAISFYLNAFFGLATSNGIRIGQFTPYGQPQYGPLLNPAHPAYSITGSGSLLYFGGDNSVWAVDLGTQVAEGRYAFAQHSSSINPLTPGDNVVSLEAVVIDGADHLFGVQEGGSVFYQPAEPTYPTNGTLTTSWARFGTVEPKRVHFVRVEGDFPVPADGSAMTVVVESINGDTATLTVPGGSPFYEFGVNTLPTAEAFRLTFNFPATTTMRSWQIKARPAPPQYQEIILPLACYDQEDGADGQRIGFPGYSMERLLALEDVTKSNRVVTAVDRWANVSYQAQISRCQFRQTVLPGRTDRNGGKVTLILRLV